MYDVGGSGGNTGEVGLSSFESNRASAPGAKKQPNMFDRINKQMGQQPQPQQRTNADPFAGYQSYLRQQAMTDILGRR